MGHFVSPAVVGHKSTSSSCCYDAEFPRCCLSRYFRETSTCGFWAGFTSVDLQARHNGKSLSQTAFASEWLHC